jgi:hypothetical protein
MATGMVSFFSSFGSFGGPPEYFWCCFVGMPIMFVGGVMTKFAYMGKVARYSAAELAPVAKDTFNYVAKESSEGVSSIAKSIKQGSPKSDVSSIETRIAKLDHLRQKGIINDEDLKNKKTVYFQSYSRLPSWIAFA